MSYSDGCSYVVVDGAILDRTRTPDEASAIRAARLLARLRPAARVHVTTETTIIETVWARDDE